MEIVDMYGVLELLSWITQEVDARPHSQGLADISSHRLLDRTVVLNPVHPGSIPHRRKIHRSISDDQILAIVQLGSKHKVSDTCQRVGAAVTFGSGKEMAGRFELSKAGVQIIFEGPAQKH